MRDGAAAMADWEADFDAVCLPQLWIHAERCPVLAPHFVEAFIARKLDQTVHIIPEAGVNILYDRPEAIVDILDQHFTDT